MNLFTESKIASYLASWCQDHLGHHSSPGLAAYHRYFATALAAKRAEQEAPHNNGGRFGMSGAGGCLRHNFLRRVGIEGTPIAGDSLVTFEIGHLLECMAVAILQASGFTVSRQQDMIRLDPAFQSKIDGVLEAGPVQLEYPLLLSVKTASYKSSQPPRGKQPAKRYGFAELPLDGIRKAQPSWFIQSQLEMAATGIPRTLVIVVAKDMIAAFREDEIFKASGSLSWYAETLRYDAKSCYLVQKAHEPEADEHLVPALYPVLSESGVVDYVQLPAPGDVESGWKGPNQEATGSFNPCFGCRYGGLKEVCR